MNLARLFTPFFALALLSIPLSQARTQEPPNFVFINIDDLGYADIGPFGSKINRTPHLDRMATEGIKLTSFYAAPVCSPSRAALMTGCYPKRVLPIKGVLFPGYDHGLSPSEVTIAETLKSQNYQTAIIGKWHLGDQPSLLPTRQGFDYWFGLPYSNDMGPVEDGIKSNLGAPLAKQRANRKPQPPLPLMRNETVIERITQANHQDLVQRYTEEAVSFLKQNKDKRFFLYLPHSAVHFPIYPGKRFAGNSPHGIYSDWVEEVDWSVGQVLNAVRELGIQKKTLVIFTSDNGGTRRASNAPLRGNKGSTWEGGIRVPTIAWWPEHIPANTSTDIISGMIDILPTFAHLAQADLSKDLRRDGGDISAHLLGNEEAAQVHEVFHYFRGLQLQAIRKDNWKLRIENRELYNLDTDIGEANNIADQNPNLVQQLLAIANAMDTDLGQQTVGPGCRPLGRVRAPEPLIDQDGTFRKVSR